MKLNIISWNIHKGIGGVDRRYDLQRVIDLLGSYAPDVLLLQEVADGMPRSRFHNQLDLLKEALAMPHAAFKIEHRFSVGGYGNAILSHWPLSNIQHTDLTIGRRKKRGVLQARCRVRFGQKSRTLIFHNMHLGLAGSERDKQLRHFLASHPFQRLHHRTPVVVAGDLNDLWGSLGPKHFIPMGFERAGSLANTFPAMAPVRPLDGIFVRGDLRVQDCLCPRSKLAKRASDHRPIVARLDLRMVNGS